MSYYEQPISRFDTDGKKRSDHGGFNSEIDRAKEARNSTLKDTDITVDYDGYLGMDNLDKMRRRKIR